jgi:cytochrome c-type biogenesis protein CcmF
MISLASFGRPSLIAALLFAVAGTSLCVAGAVSRRAERTQSGVRFLVTAAFFTGAAALSLLGALLAHDFSLDYVARYTSRSLSVAYTFAALWGGMEGSLLFWTVLLTTFAAIALTRVPAATARLTGWAGAVLGVVALFFLALLAGPADPFTRLGAVPPDGNGLNPLLQSPGMLIHPPLLYAGFVGFSIPFAFALSALLTGRLDDSWFTATRRWTLLAWSSLSIGIVLGGAWAYTELGWGGYWAWDPVENASFMPWLTATAFLHSVVIQEKRRMFKVWNVVLILLTYVLAVFGTFLTRSGILSSIHTFTEGDTGKWFLPFLAVMLLGGLGVVATRLDALRSENRFDSLLSRESAFLLNNVLFVAAAFTVLWGTIFPIVNEALTGVRVSVGPPFYNSVFIPLGLVLLALTGLGPLVSWRRMRPGALSGLVRLPAAAAASAALLLVAAGVRSAGAVAAFSLCAFTFTAIAGEFARGGRVYRRAGAPWPQAVAAATARNRRRYGGYVVHLGVVLIVIGFAGAAFRVERQDLLRIGESMAVGEYTLVYRGVETDTTPEKDIVQANLLVEREGEPVAMLRPQRNVHRAQRQAQSEVAIRTTPVDDLYVVVTSFDSDGAAAVRAFVNPLTWWIWAGAVVMAAGMALILGGRRAQPTVAPAPSVRETVAVRP